MNAIDDQALREAVAWGRAWSGTLHFSEDPHWRPRGESAASYIGTFEPSHRLSLWWYMVRRAARIRDAYSWNLIGIGPYDDAPDDIMDEFLREGEATPEFTAEEMAVIWLLDSRFMRALAALLLGDGNREAIERADPRFDHLAGLPTPRWRNDEEVWG